MSAEANEKKTRVLERRTSAVGHSAPPPANLSDKIVFTCPNGHRIVVGVELAGKQGACTKCQAPVTIPKPSGSPPAPGNGPPRPAAGSPANDRAAAPESAAESKPAGPVIDVGIPGVPATLAGEPTELEALEPVAEEAAEDGAWNFFGGQSQPPAAGGAGFAGEDGNPTAALVARLWVEREHGGEIELHLQGGSVILPRWYDANWSQGTYGLFASQEAEGGPVTLTAVAWDTVQKIIVRKLTAVPDDMFT
jgi:hypothetical protein